MPTGKTLLERMREERDELDAAIRVVERMTGPARQSKAIRDVDVALAMAASNGRGRPPKALKATRTWMAPATRARMNPPPKNKRYSGKRIRAQRQKSAEILARFDQTEPRSPSVMGKHVQGLGAFVRRGYLEKTGDGYIRTAKAYVP